MVVPESVAVGHDDCIRTADSCSKIAKQFSVWVLRRLDVLRGIGIDHDGVDGVLWHIRMISGATKWNSLPVNASLVFVEEPIQRAVQFSEPNDPLHEPRLTTDSRGIVVHVHFDARRTEYRVQGADKPVDDAEPGEIASVLNKALVVGGKDMQPLAGRGSAGETQ